MRFFQTLVEPRAGAPPHRVYPCAEAIAMTHGCQSIRVRGLGTVPVIRAA